MSDENRFRVRIVVPGAEVVVTTRYRPDPIYLDGRIHNCALHTVEQAESIQFIDWRAVVLMTVEKLP